MTGISEVLRGASEAQDADSAQVFANVLNTDLHAMKTYNGTLTYQAQDTMRLSRVLAEYERMNSASMKGGFQQRQPAARPAVSTQTPASSAAA